METVKLPELLNSLPPIPLVKASTRTAWLQRGGKQTPSVKGRSGKVTLQEA